MFQLPTHLEASQDLDGEKFTFDEWDYHNDNHRGDKPLVIGGL